MAFDPQTLGLLASAATGVMNSIPKVQLAKLGLTRLPFLAPLPLVGAVVGGAVVTAIAIPQSRKWMIEKGKIAFEAVQDFAQSQVARNGDSNSEQPSNEYSNVTVMDESSQSTA